MPPDDFARLLEIIQQLVDQSRAILNCCPIPNRRLVLTPVDLADFRQYMSSDAEQAVRHLYIVAASIHANGVYRKVSRSHRVGEYSADSLRSKLEQVESLLDEGVELLILES